MTGDYAEKVMEKYQKSFHSKPISISPAIAFVGFIDILATELTWYEINTYQKNDLMLVRK